MINVTVCYATPEKQVEIPLSVEENCTIALAIVRSRIQAQFPELSFSVMVVGVHGKKLSLDALVTADDRIEIYRSLILDPKERRRKMTKLARP